CIVVKKKGEAGSGNSLASAASSSISSDGKVDINTATKEELDKVSGIGPVTADKIVQYREKNGNYKTIDDLKKIGGIGDKTLEKFKDKLEAR
ncbi:MAG: helix-hairpin-helix domain-containing protein, partial [Bacillota bacterium]|nr:helix-hairpin-helix domain-containing protein [Bacillota bacterium]